MEPQRVIDSNMWERFGLFCVLHFSHTSVCVHGPHMESASFASTRALLRGVGGIIIIVIIKKQVICTLVENNINLDSFKSLLRLMLEKKHY